MAQNQKSGADSVIMDSRKFLGALNDSAQAKISFYSDKISEMGRSAGRNWKLAALRSKDLFIEDVNTNHYYIANHNRAGNKISINNIRSVEIVEGDKATLFEDSCMRLVNAIEANNQRDMASAFNRMKAQRFTGKTIPESGQVKTRDGVLRTLKVSSGKIAENAKNKIISYIVEALSDRVIVENGQVVAGYFDGGKKFTLPVTKWAGKKLIARQMREAAEKAYLSQGFRNRIKEVAGLVSEGKIEKAVRVIIPFLEEMEEFTLLNRSKTGTLIENALAANGIFNQQLCDDTATLFYRTNMRLSRDKILREWKKIARASENSVLAENVMILSESNNFENAYDRFLHLIFEAISNRDVTAESLATTLEVLKDKTPKIKESHELSSKLMNLIDRLKNPSFDDAAIYEAEDLIATIQEELAANESLRDFDEMPGDRESMPEPEGDDDMDFGGPDMKMGGDSKSQQPIININSPLIQIGGTSGATDSEDEDLSDIGLDAEMPDMDEEPEDEFGDLLDNDDVLSGDLEGEEPSDLDMGSEEGQGDLSLGMGDKAGMGGKEGMGRMERSPRRPMPESRRARRGLMESRPHHYEMNRDDDDYSDDEEEDELAESSDPYSYRNARSKSELINSYGAPAIDDLTMEKVVSLMRDLAEHYDLDGGMLAESLDDMASASIQAAGVRLPQMKMQEAVQQAVNFFIEQHSKKPDFLKNLKHKDEQEEDEDDFVEDQYKSPSIKGRGFKRSSINPRSRRMSEGIEWLESQSDSLLGEIGGVKFIFDHGQDNSQPVIMSEDGFSAEIPVPSRLVKSALAEAGLTNGNGQPFVEWLSGAIEQLRPISEDENDSLNEAMLKINTRADGSMDLEVHGDVDVDDSGVDMDVDDMDDMDDVDDEMKPVDTVSPADAAKGIKNNLDQIDADDMPDFDQEPGEEEEEEEEEESEEDEESLDFGADEDEGEEPEDEEEDEDEDEEEDEDELAEDKNITSPSESSYGSLAKGNKREMPAHKIQGKGNGNTLDGIGPMVKKDNGSGTKPPTARRSGK